MRLWLVFTSTLKDAEPSGEFKSRLLQITELSKSVLTFPKPTVLSGYPHLARPLQLIALVAGAATLTLCGWYAGHNSGSLEHQRLVSQVSQAEQELIATHGEVRREKDRTEKMSAAGGGGKELAANDAARLRDRISRTDAELNQYKAILERQQKAADNGKDLLLTLSSPGARLLALRGAENAPGSTAYAILIPNSKLVFVGSNLLDLPGGREYQLWIVRKDEGAPVSGGTFVPDEQGHAYVQVDDPATLSDVSGLAVTDEPAGGSAAPTGSKFLSSAT